MKIFFWSKIKTCISLVVSYTIILCVYLTGEVEVLEVGAPGHQIQDAAVGHAAAPLQLQPGQPRAVARHQRQRAVRGARAAAQVHARHARRAVAAVHEAPEHGAHGGVRGDHRGVAGAEHQPAPQPRLPRQRAQTRARGAHHGEVTRASAGGHVSQDPREQRVVEREQVAGCARVRARVHVSEALRGARVGAEGAVAVVAVLQGLVAVVQRGRRLGLAPGHASLHS